MQEENGIWVTETEGGIIKKMPFYAHMSNVWADMCASKSYAIVYAADRQLDWLPILFP